MSPSSAKRSNNDNYESESEPDDEQGFASDTEGDDVPDFGPDSGTAKIPMSDAYFKGIKRNPLKRARNLVRFFRGSDQRKELLQETIRDGNERSWFSEVDESGASVPIEVPEVQLLRDVKTRWDSVYHMLTCLIDLRQVSSFHPLTR